MMTHRDKEFDNLICLAIKIGNSLAGKTNVLERKNQIYAEGLGQKIIHHTISARHLYSGLSLVTKEGKTPPMIDFASICILTRAVLEAYLTFHYVFVDSTNSDECDFRFLCWNLGGYLDRSDFLTEKLEHIDLQKQEQEAVEVVKKEIQANTFFLSLPTKLQEFALEGRWRLNSSWSKLAVNAGFDERFFKEQYKFLCGYSHSSRLSIIQIQQTKELLKQKEMAEASMGVLMITLAKYIFDYVNFIPELKSAVDWNTFENIPIIIWKEIGENLNQGKH